MTFDLSESDCVNFHADNSSSPSTELGILPSGKFCMCYGIRVLVTVRVENKT